MSKFIRISRAFASSANTMEIMGGRPMYNRMLKRLKEELHPTFVEIVDESTLHAEHAAMRNSGYNETHFKIVIVSDRFEDKMPVQRHRMVYSLLNEEFKHGLHAVNIVAKTPTEYNQ